MRITLRALKQLPVETVSSSHLGTVHDLVLDVDTHSVLQYVVLSSLMRRQTYVIGASQVVSVSAERMVVDDGIEPEVSATKKSLLSPGALMTNHE